MTTVPNQRVVVCDTWAGNVPKGKKYSIVVHDIDEEAMRRLNNKRSWSAYVLYHYLSHNTKGFELALSPTDVKARTGLGEEAYSTAFTKLIEQGYLTQIGGNKYRFSIEPTKQHEGTKSIMGKPVDGKPSDDNLSLPGNPGARGGVSGGLLPGNPGARGGVSGGEIITENTIYNTNTNIGVYPSKGNNIARGKTNTVDDETVRDVAFALMALTKNKYSPTVYRKILKEAGDMLSSKSKLSELDTLPIWQFMRFDSEDAFYEAVKKGKSQLPPDDQDTPDLQFEEDDELPF